MHSGTSCKTCLLRRFFSPLLSSPLLSSPLPPSPLPPAPCPLPPVSTLLLSLLAACSRHRRGNAGMGEPGSGTRARGPQRAPMTCVCFSSRGPCARRAPLSPGRCPASPASLAATRIDSAAAALCAYSLSGRRSAADPYLVARVPRVLGSCNPVIVPRCRLDSHRD